MAQSVPFSSIGDVAAQNAVRFGARVAFQDDYRSVTFQALQARADRLRSGLTSLGVEAGDRVAILSKNRIECIETCLAADVGLQVVPVNWRLGGAELEFILRDCAPKALIVESAFLETVSGLLESLPSIESRILIGSTPLSGWIQYEDLMVGPAHKTLKLDPVSPSNTACIVYTSGTTGNPKGAELSHGALLAGGLRIVEEMLELDEHDVTLAVMPLFHVGGMWFHCFPSFAVGAKTILKAAFNPLEVLDAIIDHGVTNVHLAPTMVADILGRPNTARAAKSLKCIFYAASPMPVTTLKRAMAEFPQSDFFQSYGSTECGPVTWLGPQDHVAALNNDGGRLKSCGRPFQTVEIELVGETEDAVPTGEVGEIRVKSSSLLTGYWRNTEDTFATLRDGWVATGDLGKVDSEGYVFIVDRKKDMIITGGENVYPTEVENVLHAIPGIAEAAIIGVPDDRWVERVIACIVKTDDSDIDGDSVIAEMKRHLAGYKCPKNVYFLDALPKSGAGKVLRRRLLEAYPFE